MMFWSGRNVLPTYSHVCKTMSRLACSILVRMERLPRGSGTRRPRSAPHSLVSPLLTSLRRPNALKCQVPSCPIRPR